MHPNISVIVPVYNVERYLEDCIKSILLQQFQDIELILVDDGSSDNSSQICSSYAKKDRRVRFIRRLKEGVSSARNYGIEIAKGNYIAFVDADDTVEPNIYTYMFEAAASNSADMVVCPFTTKYPNTPEKDSVSKVWEEVNYLIPKQTILNKLIPAFIENYHLSLTSCWNKLYRRSVLIDFKVRFEKNMTFGEDKRFNLRVLTCIHNIIFIDKPLYNYNIRKNTSLSQSFREDLFLQALANKKAFLNICRDLNLNDYSSTLINQTTRIIIEHIKDIVRRDFSFEKKISLINNIMENDEFHKDINCFNATTVFERLFKFCSQKQNIKLIGVLFITRDLLIRFINKGN